MLPVLEAQVFCDGVEDVHLAPQLGLCVDVGHPQTAGVLCYVADLNLDRTDGSTAVMMFKVFQLTATNLHVVYLQPVKANVAAEGVIDSSYCPINLIQVLSESAQLPSGLPGRDGIC